MKSAGSKKLLILAAALMLLLLPALAFAAGAAGVGSTFTVDKIRYQVLSENTVTVISNTDETSLGDEGIGFGIPTYKGELVIPQTVEYEGVTYTVTEIKMIAFGYTDQITKVTLPGSIRKIGERAFYQCRGLEEVVLSEGLEEIGAMAFEQCTKLSKLTIPSTVIKIGSAAFGNCKLLQSLHIPAGVEEGLAKALVGNSLYPHLDHVTVAEGSPYEIEGGILYKGTTVQLYMGSQEHVTVREGTTEISTEDFSRWFGMLGAFAQNTKLKSVVLPDTITEIPENAFNSAVNMETITLPSTFRRSRISLLRSMASMPSPPFP